MRRSATKRKNLFGFGTPKALSPRQTTPARGGIAAHMPGRSKRETSETVAGSYGGYRIMKTPDGEFYSSLDPDSLFQTKKQVQSFIDWWKKGRGNPAEAFWFVVKSKGKLQLMRVSDPAEIRGLKIEGPYSSQGEAQKALTFWKANPAKFDRCVKAVKAKGGAANAYAVCTAAGTRRKNPTFWVQERFGNHWTTHSTHFNSESAEKELARWRGRFPTKEFRAVEAYKRNPASAAVEVFEEFHGHAPDEIVEVKKKIHFHEHLAGAGILKRLVVDGIDGRSHLINGFRGALLCFNESKNQLFIEGGDQAINLEDFGIKSPHELETLGKVKHIDYSTRKDHLGDEGGDAVYTHKFRTTNENGQHVTVRIARYPDLIYRVRDEQLEFSGGSYVIRAEGIDK
jgi:hypothetical protein